MKKKIEKRVIETVNIIEIFIAILLTVATAILALFLLVKFKDLIINEESIYNYNDFLEMALNLVIGIEFIKMLSRHTPETVIEVLLFALARQLIVEHTSAIENLASIVAIAVLFVIRRYLIKNENSKIVEE